MCRLYGFRGNEPTKVDCALVHAQNALIVQSRSDLTGKTHADGWGIGLYENGTPKIEQRATSAFEDLHFSVAAERVFARTVVAHVRHATVGKTNPANSHPFAHRRWMFAHNGTVTAFDRVGPRLIEETVPALRGLARGTTDSEAVFYWLLSRMERAGIDLDDASVDRPRLVGVVAEAVTYLATLSDQAGAEEPAVLNLILTDGDVLVAARWGLTLHWTVRDGIRDCEICGIPHVHHSSDTDYRAAVVASEAISDAEQWHEVPDHGIVSVGVEIETDVERI